MQFTGESSRDRRELEATLRALELRILNRIEPGVLGITDEQTLFSRNVPQVTGLAIVANIGTLTLRWSPISTPPIRYYEVEIAPTATFAGSVIRKTVNPEYTFQEGELGGTYYARVRAVTNNLEIGAPSAALNTTTGLIVTEQIAPGAATDQRSFLQLSGFAILSADTITSSFSETYGPVVADVVPFGTVLPYATVNAEIQVVIVGAAVNYLTMLFEFLRDGNVIDSIAVNVPASVGDFFPDMSGNVGLVSATGLGLPDTPPPGLHEYSIRISGSTLDPAFAMLNFRPRRIAIETVEFRR